MHRPIVLIPACTKEIGAHSYHAAQLKYVDAVFSAAACMPLILPALGENTDWDAMLSAVDGIMLTGSPSNLHPSHFNQSVRDPDLPLDIARDATTLPLIRAAVQRKMPLLAICRGAQEINVALGGSLHQAVHEVPGMMDHRDEGTTLDEQYRPRHRITLTQDGFLAQILKGTPEIMVNSLHGQGIDRLAPGLTVEARADDGLIEAYSLSDGLGFLLAMQWHPEWRATENPDSMKIFCAFGVACHSYQAVRGDKA